MTKPNKIFQLSLLLVLLSLIVIAEWYNISNIYISIEKTTNAYVNHINNMDDIEQLRAETIKVYTNQKELTNSHNKNVLFASYALGAAGVLCFLTILKTIFSFFIISSAKTKQTHAPTHTTTQTEKSA